MILVHGTYVDHFTKIARGNRHTLYKLIIIFDDVLVVRQKLERLTWSVGR